MNLLAIQFSDCAHGLAKYGGDLERVIFFGLRTVQNGWVVSLEMISNASLHCINHATR